MRENLKRVAFGSIAILGTAAWMTGVAAVTLWVQHVGAVVGWGLVAGVSWLVLGVAIVVKTGRVPSEVAWAEACLRTLAFGVAVLVAGFSTTVFVRAVVGPPSANGIALASVLASFAVMRRTLVAKARRLGLGSWATIGTWFVALAGTSSALVLLVRYLTWDYRWH
ncbi:MAG: hypothetical protein HYR85_05240 [Planctomycetes bacterium]|nr:hypothetical protein [Planctomycetota bacterium]MBI3846164.1 hypothetical protein [Planctomycetota bacterium]